MTTANDQAGGFKPGSPSPDLAIETWHKGDFADLICACPDGKHATRYWVTSISSDRTEHGFPEELSAIRDAVLLRCQTWPKLLAALASQCVGCYKGWPMTELRISHDAPDGGEGLCKLTQDERDLLAECGWKGGA